MKKIGLKIWVFLSLVSFKSISQYADSISIEFSYKQLSKIHTQLGISNSVAFYVIKNGDRRKLSYAIYNPNSVNLKVSNYNGVNISNEKFKRIRNNMNLASEIDFTENNKGCVGIKREDDNNFLMTLPLAVLKEKSSEINPITNRKYNPNKFKTYIYACRLEADNKYYFDFKIVEMNNATEEEGGGGPLKPTVQPAP